MNYFKRNNQFKPEPIVRDEYEQIVQNGLALSPSEIMEMSQRGIPISTSNLRSLEVYKTSDDDMTVPMEFRRNHDMADMYQHRQDILGKVKKASDEYFKSLTSNSE